MEESEDSDQQERCEFLPGFPTFEDYSKNLLSQVLVATKSSNGLPEEGDDFDYYMSFPGFSTFCSKMTTRIDRVINKVVRYQQLPCYWGIDSGASEVTKVEEKFEMLVEANDILLERVNVLLDEVSGLRKNLDQPVVSGESVQQGTVEVSSRTSKRDSVKKQMGVYKFIHSRNVTRPQLKFRDQVDNGNNSFIPRIKTKLNARVPLPEVFQRLEDSTSLSALIANTKKWVESEAWSTHPYQFELENLEPYPEQLQVKEPQQPGSNDDTPLTFIDTLEGLEQLTNDLKTVKEFAVDLEHHSYRSFQGFTCLMQLSTRSHDYIVDTLAVRHHMQLLLDPFTDPAILKVMHGADFDVEWLQKDFGLYVVNLFDTGQASRVLQLPKLSLAFLLQYCCQVQADKQYQLADWRIRPLPQEMMSYARDDTHYLLYIYDRMKNELIRRGDKSNHLLHLVLTKSRNLCLKQYRKPIFSENAYLELYYKHKRNFNSRQLLCLKLLYAWRDHVARDEDESTGYVLPNHMLFQIAEILPREMGGVLACCNPIPILLRQQQHEVFMLVQQARDSPLTDKLPTIERKKKEPERAGTSEMEVNAGDVSEATPTPVTRIAITGPPVKVVKPVVSVFEKDGRDSRPDARVVGVKQVLSKFLLQYTEAREMTASEVLLQQQLAYEALAASSRTKSDQPQPSTVTEQRTSVLDDEHAVKEPKKRTLSVREIGQEAVTPPERPVKKSCTSQDNADFTPFRYQDSQYTDYTPQGGGRETFDPHRTPRGRGSKKRGQDFPAPPRSRVQQKAGQKSHTYRRKN